MRTRDENLTGRKFTRLEVVKYAGLLGRERVWNCRCDCGNEVLVRTRDLRKERTKSCGCYGLEVKTQNGKNNKRHGLKSTPEYRAWCGIIVRCENKNCEAWPNYGGRGITVCDRWRNSFEAFLADVGRRPSPEHSLDRKDNDRGYSKENVRWATRIEQANNKRGLRYATIDGQRLTIAQAARAAGMHYNTLIGRLNRGQSIEEAIK